VTSRRCTVPEEQTDPTCAEGDARIQRKGTTPTEREREKKWEPINKPGCGEPSKFKTPYRPAHTHSAQLLIHCGYLFLLLLLPNFPNRNAVTYNKERKKKKHARTSSAGRRERDSRSLYSSSFFSWFCGLVGLGKGQMEDVLLHTMELKSRFLRKVYETTTKKKRKKKQTHKQKKRKNVL